MNKIFRINGVKGRFTEDEIIEMIEENIISEDDYITTPELKQWIKVSNTIYQFYREESK